ncbi:MAG: ParB N-terminal domain-containing protein [Candidatus Undinarchaeales archaeon]
MEILERFEDGVVAVIEIDKLYDHEQVKYDYLDQLADDIKRAGELRYPIIVDKYSRVVLDGHHRYYAIKSLGYKKIPAFVVDYYKTAIKLDRWSPVLHEQKEIDTVFDCLKKDGFEINEAESEEVMRMVVRVDQAALGIVLDGKEERYYLVQSKDKGYEEAMDCVKNAVYKLNQKELAYVAGSHNAVEQLRKGKIKAAIVVPKLQKHKVIESAVEGEVLPPKSTRHIIPEKKYYPVSLKMLEED